MLGKYYEVKFKQWFLKNSAEGTYIIRSQGVGIPDYCILTPDNNKGIFIEVKYKEFGSVVPSFKILRKQQRLFFYNFNYCSYVAYKTSHQQWKIFYFDLYLKKLIQSEVFSAYK